MSVVALKILIFSAFSWFLCFRLTFWLSNIIALREIILQAFGKTSDPSQFTETSESNGSEHIGSGKLTRKKKQWTKQSNGFKQVFEDWQETETFTAALEKVEFWIFSRIVESVWWQVRFQERLHISLKS